MTGGSPQASLSAEGQVSVQSGVADLTLQLLVQIKCSFLQSSQQALQTSASEMMLWMQHAPRPELLCIIPVCTQITTSSASSAVQSPESKHS